MPQFERISREAVLALSVTFPTLRISVVAIVLFVAALGQPISHSQASATVTFANVKNAGEIVPLPNNQLLITDIGGLDRQGGRVLIADMSGHLIWQYKGHLDIPHSAYPMSNGNILIADAGDNRVIEVDRESKIVWDSDNLGSGKGRLGQGTLTDGTKLDYPNDAKPLPNGDFMISCRLQDRVVIITPEGTIVRQISGFLHRQHNPDILSNGDVLVADSGADRVLEVNIRNEIVWAYGGAGILAWPRDANLLPNGHILITDSDHNRVVEVTRGGAIVREWSNLSRPYSATSLPNGDILVGDGGTYGVVELNPKDKIVWKLNHPSKGGGHSGKPRGLRNGGFEQTVNGSKWELADWNRNDALAYSTPPGKRVSMVRDGKYHHGGKYSARIIYHGDSNGIFFGQTVPVTAGHRYRFSGWIKTRNIRPCYPCSYGSGSPSGRTAEYELNFNTGIGASPAPPALPVHKGTTKWKHDSLEFVVPQGVRSVGVQCELRGQGAVWFDDVRLDKLN